MHLDAESVPSTGETPRIIAGRYTVERLLGRGATANVYLAHDAETGDEVAVKVLLPEIAHGIGISRFLREIRLTSPFKYPNIVGIRDSGVADDDLPFFVMPFMEGGSLRERLQRESQLSLAEAARITREVADALAHAHSMGLIHRDVKPENILFSGGRAMVSDFGIARAIAGSENISGTTPGVIRGTPAYMSPEQASGEADLDARTDVYSLACVAYEMIAGLPPFVGPNARNVMAQRMTRDALAIQTYRASAPAALSDVMKRAMAVDPADRESDPREFARRLTESIEANQGPLKWRAPRVIAVGAAAAVIGAVSLASAPTLSRFFAAEKPLDSLRIVVGSATPEPGAASKPDAVAAGVAAAASSWSDVRVTSLGVVDAGDPSAARSTFLRDTKRSGSRWLIELQGGGRAGGSIVDATLVDAATGREIGHAKAPASADSAGASDYRWLIARLFGGSDADASAPEARASFDAWRSYVRGRGEMERWQLDSAERSLSDAFRANGALALAAVRLGQINVWRKEAISPAVRTAIVRAAQAPRVISKRDSLIANGVLAMDGDDPPAACAAFDMMRRVDSLDVVAWLGLGDCRTRDHVVIQDGRSPSGLRFRTSYQSGVDAYLKAARIDPATSRLFCPLNGLGVLITSANRMVVGSARPPDTSRFAAWPSFDPHADTVLLIPYPFGAILSSDAVQLHAREDQAIERLIRSHIRTVVSLAEAWTGVAPSDPDAHEALAAALELRGEIVPSAGGLSAGSEIETARRLTADPQRQLRLAAALVRVALKAGDFSAARARVDSVLAAADHAARGDSSNQTDAITLAALAALTRRDGALRHWLIVDANEQSRANPAAADLPVQVRRDLAVLSAVVDARRCDSIPVALERSEAALERFVAPSARNAAWMATMPRLLSLATPCDGGHGVLEVRRPTDRLILMQQAYARREFSAVRAHLDTLQRFRGVARPGDVSIDYTVQEAWLLAQIGDSAKALVRLRETLGALPTLGRDLLTVGEQAAAICSALDLGAAIARPLRDQTDAVMWEQDRRALCPTRP